MVCQLIFHSASVNTQALDLGSSQWCYGRLPGSCVRKFGGHLRDCCVLLVCLYLGVLARNFLYLYLIFFKWCVISEEKGNTFLESRRRMVRFYTGVLISP